MVLRRVDGRGGEVGYTLQDALGQMGLNDMVGHVQDAITGRFLSADPTLPARLIRRVIILSKGRRTGSRDSAGRRDQAAPGSL